MATIKPIESFTETATKDLQGKVSGATKLNKILKYTNYDPRNEYNGLYTNEVFLDGEWNTISGHNNKENLEQINNERSGFDKDGNLIPITEVGAEQLNVDELRDYMKYINDYDDKINAKMELLKEIFDTEYSKSTYKGVPNTILSVKNSRIDKYPIYTVLNASQNVQLYYVIRGVKTALKRIKTSGNNYIFKYPKYLLNVKQIYDSIEYVEVVGTGTFYSDNNIFGNNDVEDYDGTKNLNKIKE